ncbi:MAG TPA: NTP transferase domain-containing protein [Thermoplasmata archaeon]|nr:NTP transferase domain-containing protein [Thermoplasmata archaeon]
MISAIVLAAGTSSRMGQPKVLVRIDGRPVLDRVLGALRASRVKQILVVLGPQASRVRREVPLDGATVVVNPHYAKGMSTSLRAGIASLDPRAEAFLVVLADQPFVSPTTMDALIARREESGAKILIPTFGGARGNPVLVDRSLSEEVEAISGDQGCRAIFGDHTDEILEVPVGDPGVLLDLDTPEQLKRIEQAIERGESPASWVAELVPQRPPHEDSEASPRAPSARSRIDVSALADELRKMGEPFVFAVVVRAVRPTSGKPGFKAVIRSGREIVGWLGGSCVESAVLAESVAALRDGQPRVLRLSREAGVRPPEEGVVEYVMECHSGGAMDIYLEPNVPKPRLLVVGNSPVAAALMTLGGILSYRVVAVAPRATREEFPDADEVISDLDRLPDLATGDTFAVVATMGKYDELSIRVLAPSPVAYVGLVASRKRSTVLLADLKKEGVPPGALGRVRSPAGLDLAAQTPEEIALSILAEITQARRASPRSVDLPLAAEVTAHKTAGSVDPVCGMEVDPSTPLRATHNGATYYFCSESCRVRFLESPAEFLE